MWNEMLITRENFRKEDGLGILLWIPVSTNDAHSWIKETFHIFNLPVINAILVNQKMKLISDISDRPEQLEAVGNEVVNNVDHVAFPEVRPNLPPDEAPTDLLVDLFVDFLEIEAIICIDGHILKKAEN